VHYYSGVNCFVWYPGVSCRINHHNIASVNFDWNKALSFGTSSIERLLRWGSPANVAWFISRVIVNSVDCVSRGWARAQRLINVTAKLTVAFRPFFANRYPSLGVVDVLSGGGTQGVCSDLNHSPRSVESTSCFTMGSQPFASNFSDIAAATFDTTSGDMTFTDDPLFTAVAAKEPTGSAIDRLGSAQGYQAMETGARDVLCSHGLNYSPHVHLCHVAKRRQGDE
jgi:hypothetical protein